MLEDLERSDRLRLMQFVCSFAWADLRVRQAERQFVARMIRRLGLDAEEIARVQGWLAVPPDPESVDPTTIPAEHRKLFVESIEGVIAADGEVSPEEQENLELLQLLIVD